MTPVIETAYAKLNLALHVRRRREDGYHELETLFAFAKDGDTLSATMADTIRLEVVGPFAAAIAGSNLVLRAAEALAEVAGAGHGAHLVLTKNLPVAAGIGGGSADAAAALRLLARLWGVDPADERIGAIAASLGADVPACLRSETAFGTGKGEALAEVPLDLAGTPALLVNPRVPLSTGPVFAGWDGMDRGPLDPARSLHDGRNDLEPPARALVPEIGAVLDLLGRQPGVTLARMSGSGATCFALFDDAEAMAAAERAMPAGWWTLATTLR
ncbi:4-(cytidine 5'-diphospho)-2-C-methyl-D-erythritol kinase [Sphingomonas jatrophae]|uniref:4-diphosphocytidyl-2-C-methyl-D-erythritol kinase n=1 Tax=Sphingomonas jatrophae TaxID=1166337 RepID=A0A1I6JIZ9_9SPHN|nr:4-(cytidine 5'-diphospho)-2-C-methyl-D-erythritol kinase [Sphingomonas jatrophae]SFR78903.1 4-diphosphocytidyl-2-C-methyl-D-erythritol kinase [Sphingomonas jatrophae]